MSQATFPTNKRKHSVVGVTGITVQGYKSLYEERNIEVRPLTILGGANSSGKSSIMQPLLLMKQTLEALYDPGALLLNGPNVQFTFAEQFISQAGNREDRNIFSIGIEADGHTFVRNVFDKRNAQDIEIVETTYLEKHRKIFLSPRMSQQEILDSLREVEIITHDQEYNEIAVKLTRFEPLRCEILRERCFLQVYCERITEFYDEFGEKLSKYAEDIYDNRLPIDRIGHCIRDLIHVPGLRNNPDRAYKVAAIGANFPGKFEEYVASLVNNWKNSRDRRILDLEGNLRSLGLTNRINTNRANDVQIELLVNRLFTTDDSEDMVSLADVGFGVSQILPVLVALLVAQTGQLVYLEQPEIHLHPRAQVALAQIVADAANRGVRVVVETHSELLLVGIQSLVAEGKLSPDKVKLHWFTRREDGVTEVSSADLDETGAFGDWPEDFGTISLDLQNRYLSAAESRLWQR
ncbi:DUF3696 domain-containing protein [Kovacikia minuta CCNUW1]|uniref:AAA family ATPase n=1 Tax=Kovacikia minuta TaxID=2931930 RepID=UPI001CCADAC3|nr:AAA family ATPase [Kovacikia minuta]UBF25671.1 DUF3696 domain-containing protein [Kovacikia minuta CCNUW1]